MPLCVIQCTYWTPMDRQTVRVRQSRSETARVKQSVSQSINQAGSQAGSQSIRLSVNQSVNQTVNQSVISKRSVSS